ncbi:MAG: selenium-dependent molybdenum cofactor biosynthesis protein YqeB [Eubacteriales bacterium]|nr:selenium-dependent molybdenum cofactor biosynthesis protein YqeB [Eubacteriales bacterium]
MSSLKDKLIIVRGGGDLASGVIYVLKKAGFSVLCLEIERPSAIRRTVAYSEAVYDGKVMLEGYKAVLCDGFNSAMHEMHNGNIAVLVDPEAKVLNAVTPFALVDAVLAKRNMGTTKDMAPLTIALGPGFEAGKDADYVIETMRGHNLGRIIENGTALPNTGVPGLIAGHSSDRVIHAEREGILYNKAKIGDIVEEGQVIAEIKTENGEICEVKASFKGLLRGLIRDGFYVTEGFKIADIDARENEHDNCYTISDKARALGGAVLTALCVNL